MSDVFFELEGGLQYIYDGDEIIKHDSCELSLESNHLYQVITQMSGNGQMGFGFMRMDNSPFAPKDAVTINGKKIVIAYELSEKGQIYSAFQQSKTRESARKSGIQLVS